MARQTKEQRAKRRRDDDERPKDMHIKKPDDSRHSRRSYRTAGGLHGERTASLYAACARPFQTVFGEDAFSTPIDKAAALFHGIIAGHAFSDANKRTGTLAAIHLLTGLGYLTDAPSERQVRRVGDLAVEVASGSVTTVEEIAERFAAIFGT